MKTFVSNIFFKKKRDNLQPRHCRPLLPLVHCCFHPHLLNKSALIYNLSNQRKVSLDAILVSHLELSAGGGRQKDGREGVAGVSRSLLLARKHLGEQNVVADDYIQMTILV